jgi:LmbE family N-acetylglucosaminyl deacetylase
MTEEMTQDLPAPKRALALGAHPDDVEFGCGGTLAKWAAAGCEIFHVVCTDGARGSWNPDENVAELVRNRQEEQRAASVALGGRGEVAFLGWPDGELESGLRQRWQVCYWIRYFRPDVVLGHDPWKRYRLHPDHRNAGFLLTDGVVAARDPLYFPEQSVPAHRPGAMLLWEADEPNHREDVSSFVDTKLAALMEHSSQMLTTMRVDDRQDLSQVEMFKERVRGLLAENGAPAGLAAAELFHHISRL